MEIMFQGELASGNLSAEPNRDFSNPMYDMQSGGSVSTVPEPATLAPSLVATQTPPTHRELNPVSIDTGKDTQRLVEDDSEC